MVEAFGIVREVVDEVVAERLGVVDPAVEDLVEDAVRSIVDLIDLVVAAADITRVVMQRARCGEDLHARHG